MEADIIELFISIIIVGGIGAVLALLLEIAYMYLGNYGERRILINDEREIVVMGGRSLLASLKEEKIFIPSACGGKGTCAYCKVRVSEGGGPVLPTETPYLSHEEAEEDIRLSCQVKVKDDLKIHIPEDLFLIREFKGKVAELIDLTDEIKGLTMDILSPEEGINFKPGQYVQLEVPKYKLIKSPEYRAYSISSDSEQSHRIELVITRVPEGAVTTYVHDYMKKGEVLALYGPYGDFYLRESARGILMVATGSGLAPIKSMLHQIERKEIKRDTRLFFGARTLSDLYYYEELRELEKRMDNFIFTPTLSRPDETDQWQGEKGRVTALIDKYVPERAAIDVYLCGSPNMIETCIDHLKKKGISEGSIYFDKFE